MESVVLTGIALLLAGAAAAWLLHRRRLAAGGLPVKEPAADPSASLGAAREEPDIHAGTGEPIGPAIDGGQLLPCLHAVVLGQRSPARPMPILARGHAEVASAAAAVLGRIEKQPRYTPRRPQLLPQLMRTINDPDASGRAIAAIIARDPALAGNLLRIANSALYRVQSRPVEDIQRAVALVGTDGIRQIIAAALVQPVMSADGGVFGRFSSLLWEHTLLSAAAAADHARVVEREDPFVAQLLGLMHGLGATVALRVLRDQYARKPLLIPDPLLATALLDDWAAPAAGRLAATWELSERIGQALDEQTRTAAPSELSPLGRSLRFGRLAGGLSMLFRQGRMDEPAALSPLVSTGGGEAAIAGIWARVRRGVDTET